MELKEFQELLQEKLEEIEELVNQLPYKGDTCHASQKVCLLNSIKGLSSNINGLTLEDFI